MVRSKDYQIQSLQKQLEQAHSDLKAKKEVGGDCVCEGGVGVGDVTVCVCSTQVSAAGEERAKQLDTLR